MVRNGILILLILTASWFIQDNTIGQVLPGAQGVFVVAYRTPGHARASSPEIFHSAAMDVRKILTEGKVLVVEDKERGFIENESPMSVHSMTRLAREAGAASLLFVTVDRPSTKWIKLKLQAYDLNAKLLWEESFDSGMSAMSGSAGYKKCFEKLGKKLPGRIGGPGLPINAR